MLLLWNPHRFVRAVHGLHKLKRLNGSRADGVCAAQTEHPQWGTLIRGTGMAVHPGRWGRVKLVYLIWRWGGCKATSWVGGLTCNMLAARPAGWKHQDLSSLTWGRLSQIDERPSLWYPGLGPCCKERERKRSFTCCLFLKHKCMNLAFLRLRRNRLLGST